MTTDTLPVPGALLLLGESGSGKTNELQRLAADRARRFDLGAFTQEGTLEAALRDFCQEAILEDRVILLDALDEALIGVRSAVDVVARVLERCSPRPAVVLTCRTGACPMTLPDRLRQLYTEVAAYELCMLRRRDVELAARAGDVAPEAFLAEIEARGIASLASTPITLRLLLGLWTSGALPERRSAVYQEGMLALCRQSEARQDRRSLPESRGRELSAEELLAIARRIAACVMLCGKSAVELRSEASDPSTLGIEDLIGGFESVADDQLPIDETAVRAAIAHTGLFTGRGPGTVGFAHKSYGEFLAAEFLAKAPLPEVQLSALLQIPDQIHNRVIPQLHEVAAHLADLQPAFASALMNAEPEVLLRCDLRVRRDSEKVAIAEGLLQAIESGRIIDLEDAVASGATRDAAVVSIQHSIRGLSCSGLGDLLDRWMRDGTTSMEARIAAVEIAWYCGIRGLSGDLASVALDSAVPFGVRLSAVRAIGDLGDHGDRLALLPLADGLADDTEDELKGAALAAMWPRCLRFPEMLGMLKHPRRKSFYGSYRAFLSSLELDAIDSGDLPEALRWAASSTRRAHPLDDLERVTAAITSQAWERLEVPGVLDALADLVVTRLTQYCEISFATPSAQRAGRHSDRATNWAALSQSADRRRRLIEACLMRLPAHDQAHLLFGVGGTPIVRPEDFSWALELATRETGERAGRFAHLARALCLFEGVGPLRNPHHVEPWLDARARSSAIREAFNWPLAVELDSDEAVAMRREWRRARAWELRHERAQARLRPTHGRHASLLELLRRCESVDVRWFPRLCEYLAFDDHFEYKWTLDLTQSPGWMMAPDEERSRLTAVASDYLINCPLTDITTGQAGGMSPTAAAQAAMLLWCQSPASLQGIDNARLQAIVGAVVQGLAAWCGNATELRESVFGWAHELLPVMVEDAVLESITETLDTTNCPEALRLLDDRASAHFRDRLLAWAVERLEGAKVVLPVLDWLVQRGSSEAVQAAARLIPREEPTTSDEWQRAIDAVRIVARAPQNGGWSSVREYARRSDEWCKRVLVAIAPGRRYARGVPMGSESEGEDIKELVELLFAHFHPRDDPTHEGVYSPGEDDDARHWRERLVRWLVDAGTVTAVAQLRSLADRYPEVERLRSLVLEGEKQHRRQKWQPLTASELLGLRREANRRFVRSGEELLVVLCESLRRWEAHVRRTDTLTSLWDEVSHRNWRPKDEESLSQLLMAWLEQDINYRGILLGRELQLTRRTSEAGEAGRRVDIWVEAVADASRSGTDQSVRAVIEVKGSWNRQAKSGLRDQLAERYLQGHGAAHGLYVVGWFDAPGWDATDNRRGTGPWNSAAAAITELEAEVERLHQEEIWIHVRPLILNCSLR